MLGRLEQERAGPAAGELAVDADRGLAVGEQPADDRDDPVGRERRAELRSRPSAVRVSARRSRGRGADDRVEHVGVEAGAVAGVAGRADLVDLDQHRVAVAVQRDATSPTAGGRRCRP